MQPTLETLSPQFFVTRPIEEISDWFVAQRVRNEGSLVAASDDTALRKKFGELSGRWSPLLTHQQLKSPELTAIHQLAVRALEISKLIYGELENARQGQTLLVPYSLLAQMLDGNSLLLDQVSSQLELVDSTVNYAEEIHETIYKLVLGKTISPVWLVSLARRIRLEMRPQSPVWQWMPLPGLKLSDCITPKTWNSEPEVYATGIQTARLVGWLGMHLPQLENQLELLIVAALLQDIGFLRLERSTRKRPSDFQPRDEHTYRRHSSLGASLAAGVSDYSIELSFLIAQHHERLDGTGYPHGLTRYQQSKEVQVFANLVRFQELVARQPSEASTVEEACYLAGFQLFLESAQGAWSTRSTIELLEAFDSELPTAFENSLATGQPFAASTYLEKRWTRHAPHKDVPAPHFLFSRRKSLPDQNRSTVPRSEKFSTPSKQEPKG